MRRFLICLLATLALAVPHMRAQTNPAPAPQDVASPPPDAERSNTGLASKVITRGTGTVHPNFRSTVTVNYTGWTADGRQFDSSASQGGPARFPLTSVIPGWTEGVQLMVQGEKRRFWIPGKLAYGDAPAPGTPAGTLTFDIELVSFTTPGPPPPVPADVAAPPADAAKTASGLASKVLKAGTGTEHPTPTQKVTVHYSGWTTDGQMFDSSITRGEPATFAVTSVIPGFAEAVQLMVVGESRRFWIPGNLAYDNNSRPGAPKGMLVFDIELLEIK
jgi:peptidylprolyl isomerase